MADDTTEDTKPTLPDILKKYAPDPTLAAPADPLDRVQENVKKVQELGQPRPQGLSDVFTQALVGFLPVIAGAISGNAEDVASGAKVGVNSLGEMQAQRELENKRREDQLKQGIQLAEMQAKGENQRNAVAIKSHNALVNNLTESYVKNDLKPFQELTPAEMNLQDRFDKSIKLRQATLDNTIEHQGIAQDTREGALQGGYIKAFNKDIEPQQKIVDIAHAANSLLSDMKAGKPISTEMLSQRLIAIEEVKRKLPHAEAESYGGSVAAAAKIQDWFSRRLKNERGLASTEVMENTINALEKSAIDTAKEKALTHSQQYEDLSPGISSKFQAGVPKSYTDKYSLKPTPNTVAPINPRAQAVIDELNARRLRQGK